MCGDDIKLNKEEKIKKDLVKTRKIIQEKFKQIYKDRITRERNLSETFKPIISSINDLKFFKKNEQKPKPKEGDFTTNVNDSDLMSIEVNDGESDEISESLRGGEDSSDSDISMYSNDPYQEQRKKKRTLEDSSNSIAYKSKRKPRQRREIPSFTVMKKRKELDNLKKIHKDFASRHTSTNKKVARKFSKRDSADDLSDYFNEQSKILAAERSKLSNNVVKRRKNLEELKQYRKRIAERSYKSDSEISKDKKYLNMRNLSDNIAQQSRKRKDLRNATQNQKNDDKRMKLTPTSDYNLYLESDDVIDSDFSLQDNNENSTVKIKDAKRGSGFESTFIPYNPNIVYEYFDNPNELCDRLRLLVSSRSAGNTNHSQEINSIIEELRELELIE